MVANDKISKHSDMSSSKQMGREELKVKLKTVRYINKKESVLCVSHVDEDDRVDEDRSSLGSDHSSESCDSDAETRVSSDSESKSRTDKPSKGRKSVRFVFNDDKENSDFFMDNSSIASEPVRDTTRRYTYPGRNEDDISLPPIKTIVNKPNKEKFKERWPGKHAKNRVSSIRTFESLNPLGLSPRITRKMSSQTLSDLQHTLSDSRESLNSQSSKHSVDNRPQQQPVIRQRNSNSFTVSSNLNVITETATPTKAERLLPRRLEDVYPKLPNVTSNFAASDQETKKLDFIRQALSPVSDATAIGVMRNRAATISGGEKHSWIMQRRSSKENVGAWVSALQTKYNNQSEMASTKPAVTSDNWMSSEELDV